MYKEGKHELLLLARWDVDKPRDDPRVDATEELMMEEIVMSKLSSDGPDALVRTESKYRTD